MKEYKSMILMDNREEPNAYHLLYMKMSSNGKDPKKILEHLTKDMQGYDLDGKIFAQETPVEGMFPIIHLHSGEALASCRVLGLVDKEEDVSDKTYEYATSFAEKLAKKRNADLINATSKNAGPLADAISKVEIEINLK